MFRITDPPAKIQPAFSSPAVVVIHDDVESKRAFARTVDFVEILPCEQRIDKISLGSSADSKFAFLLAGFTRHRPAPRLACLLIDVHREPDFLVVVVPGRRLI